MQLDEARLDGLVALSPRSWQMAAGVVIAREAGTRVVGPDGSTWSAAVDVITPGLEIELAALAGSVAAAIIAQPFDEAVQAIALGLRIVGWVLEIELAGRPWELHEAVDATSLDEREWRVVRVLALRAEPVDWTSVHDLLFAWLRWRDATGPTVDDHLGDRPSVRDRPTGLSLVTETIG